MLSTLLVLTNFGILSMYVLGFKTLIADTSRWADWIIVVLIRWTQAAVETISKEKYAGMDLNSFYFK